VRPSLGTADASGKGGRRWKRFQISKRKDQLKVIRLFWGSMHKRRRTLGSPKVVSRKRKGGPAGRNKISPRASREADSSKKHTVLLASLMSRSGLAARLQGGGKAEQPEGRYRPGIDKEKRWGSAPPLAGNFKLRLISYSAPILQNGEGGRSVPGGGERVRTTIRDRARVYSRRETGGPINKSEKKRYQENP